MKKKVTEDYKAISLWWSGAEESLNLMQVQIYARIDFADNLIRKYGSGKDTAQKLYEHFNQKQPKYSVRQAYIDMDWSMELMNSMSRRSKEMDKLWATEVIKGQIRKVLSDEFYGQNPAIGKIKIQVTAVDIEKRATTIRGLFKELRETLGYHLSGIDLPDFDGMGSNSYTITTNPEDVGIRKAEITEEIMRKYAEPKAKMYQMMAEEADDIDHTEVNE